MIALPRVLHDLLAGRTAAAGTHPTTDIAVVIPLYNHVRYIEPALRSVLAQTAPPRQIVLIDDGSQDEGFARAESLLRDVPNCRMLAQPNAGAHAAINRAVGLTDAPFVAVLNSDDVFAPDKLALCQDAIGRKPGTDLIAGRVALIDERGDPLSRGPAAEWLRRAHEYADRSGLDQLSLLHENHVATTSNMVFSRALWQRMGGFAALRYCHDLDFLVRAYAYGRVEIDRKRVLVDYRVHRHNTIAEDSSAIRLELAAVIASALCEQGTRLVPSAPDALAPFMEMLNAKAMAAFVVYLMTQFPRFADRDAFFAFVTAPANRDRFARHLRG